VIGITLMGSRSVSCIASEATSGGDEEENVMLALTEMVG